jgi:hypothetical protein
MTSATSGRLDGLLGRCGALLREAIPGGAPHGIVPMGTRTLAAQCRVRHARRGATSRVQLRQDHSHGARTQTPALLVAWASSPRKDHVPSEQRPHDGQDARRTMGWGPRERCQSFRLLRIHRRHVAPTLATTGSATRVAENQRPRQRRGQDQGRRQRAASGSDTVSDSGHGHGSRSRTKPLRSTDGSPQPAHRPRLQSMLPTTNRCAQIPSRTKIEPWPGGSSCTSHAVSGG